jgi:hypothetical protein
MSGDAMENTDHMAGCAGILERVCRFLTAGLSTPFNPSPQSFDRDRDGSFLTVRSLP